MPPPCPYNYRVNHKRHHMTYTVACPALGEEEIVTDLDRAMDICFSMHDESDSYAYIRDQFGDIVGEYGDVMKGIADLLF